MNRYLDTSDERDLRELFAPLRELEPTPYELARLYRAVHEQAAPRRRRDRLGALRPAPLRLGLAGSSLAVVLIVIALALDLVGGSALDSQQIVARAAAAVLVRRAGIVYTRERITLNVPGFPSAPLVIDSWSDRAGGRQRAVLYEPGGKIRLELAAGPSSTELYTAKTSTISVLPALPRTLLEAGNLYGNGVALYQAALHRRQGITVTGTTTLDGIPVYRLVAALRDATVTVLVDRRTYRPLQLTTVQRGSALGGHPATTVDRVLRFELLPDTPTAQSLVRLARHPGATLDRNPRALRGLFGSIHLDRPRRS
jgi:hypothetical protein